MLNSKLFDEAIATLTAQGFEIRYEHLGGSGTGYCQLGTQRWMVIDVSQPEEEQLEQLVAAIGSLPLPSQLKPSSDLQALLVAQIASS